jgi:phosphoribosyl-ATP pyrophosphohydrolase
MSALDRLAATVDARRGADPGSSWTAKLLSRGPEKCAEKFGEEAIEAIVEAVRGDRERLVSEAADVLYHLVVMLASRDVRSTMFWRNWSAAKASRASTRRRRARPGAEGGGAVSGRKAPPRRRCASRRRISGKMKGGGVRVSS